MRDIPTSFQLESLLPVDAFLTSATRRSRSLASRFQGRPLLCRTIPAKSARSRGARFSLTRSRELNQSDLPTSQTAAHGTALPRDQTLLRPPGMLLPSLGPPGTTVGRGGLRSSSRTRLVRTLSDDPAHCRGSGYATSIRSFRMLRGSGRSAKRRRRRPFTLCHHLGRDGNEAKAQSSRTGGSRRGVEGDPSARNPA